MKPFYTLRFLICCALFQLSALNHTYGQNTPTLNIQGVLRNSNGTAVDNGIYRLRFSLYTVETGGVAVWSETQDSVVLSGGVYSTALGKNTPMTAAFDQTYYLGVKVGSGQEMTPRALLSSAPYALSLIGQSNTFPSIGTVGVGTNAPNTGYQLHAQKSDGAGKFLLEGSTGALIDFKKGTTTGILGFGTANNDFIVNPGANNTTLQYNGDTKLTVNADGVNVSGTLNATNLNYTPANLVVTSKLAVGQSSVDANNVLKVAGRALFTSMLEVNGSLSDFGGVHKGAYCDYGHCGTNSVAIPVSIRTSNAIVASGGLWSVSDFRIKKNIQSANPASDLSLLRQLRVTNYAYIDEIGKGTRNTNGFIAQEVASVYPEAVSLSMEFIPNIYQRTQTFKKQTNLLTVSLENDHKLVAGDQVKIILPNDAQQVFEVKSTPSVRSFTIEWNQEVPETIFVFGKKVNDFHTVDYNRIFTLNVSATQELARKVEQLEKENQALKLENSTLKAADERFESRLKMLESKLNN